MAKTIKDFMNENYDYVSYRLTLNTWNDSMLEEAENDEMLHDLIEEHSTFAGSFAIEDKKIISLDGDSYSEDEIVIWSETFTNEKCGVKNGLCILVPAKWN